MDKSIIVGVLGAGAMGSGIAQVAATYGHNVVIIDNNEEQLNLAQNNISNSLKKLIEKQKISEEIANGISSRLSYSTDINMFAPCGLVIEAIVENLEIKKEVLSKIEKIISEKAVIGTNTSSLSIASISSALKNKERFLGIHFFNPPTILPLVEIVPSQATSNEITNSTKELITNWGKYTVLAKDTPGFIVNRVARPFYGEAMRILEEGIADIPTIDWAMREIGGFRMGPFELTDFIGHDVNYIVTETVWTQMYYDPRFKPSLVQKRLLESGFLGRKSGRGFYNYSADAEQPKANEDRKNGEKIFNRIFAMLVNEASDALYLNIATREDLDGAMVKGLNYPKGLLKWADEVGLEEIYSLLKHLHEEYCDDRYRPNILLKRLASHGNKFWD